jgi:hypothetical protein
MRTMKTWQNFAADSGTATTRWNYDLYRGWLASKDYPDASTGQPPAQEGTGGPTYTYTAAGRLSSRVWKGGITTTYGCNNAGDLAAISYSDTTPGTTNGVDRRSRRIQVVRDGIPMALTDKDAAQPLTETYTANSGAAGMVTTRTYDKLNRLTLISSQAYGAAATDLPTSFAYQYNAANQRTRARLGDGSFWV